MKKLALLSDVFFAFLISGIVSAFLFKTLRLRAVSTIILATVCGLLTAFSVGAWLLYRRKNVHLKRADEREESRFLLHLNLLSDEGKTVFFQNLLSSKNAPCHRFGRLRLYTKTEFYFLKFTFSPVSADDVATFSRLKTGKQKILFCNEIEQNALALCQRLSIEVKTGPDVYTLVKNADALPSSYVGEPTPFSDKTRRLRLCFSKKNSRRCLTGGAMLLLFAGISPFAFYYVFIGVVLLLSAVLIRVFGYE